MGMKKRIFRYNIWLSRHLILYNMNKFHDNIVFQIDEKYSTLLFKCHFRSSFLYCCIMFLPKVCDTEIQKYTQK